ncbi:MAG: site-2 protease family protein [Chloroflexota bacterium]
MFARIRQPAIGGVRIFVSPIWLAVALALAGTTISLIWPDRTTSLWLVAIGTGVLGIIGSLAIHEVAHIAVARRLQQGFRGVAPDLLGGLPDMSYNASDPGRDVRIALAGPVGSALLALGFALVWWGTSSSFDPLPSVALVLALFNAGLAFFNLMPGYPFDGSRILRAFIWYIHGDFFLATRIVGYYGYFHILMVIAFGAYLVSTGGRSAVWGAWVILAGWMWAQAIGRGVTHVFWLENAKRLRVNDVFAGGGNRVDGERTIQESVETLLEMREEGPTLVFEQGEAAGIVDLGVVRRVRRAEWSELKMRDIMQPLTGFQRVDTGEPLEKLFDLLPYGGSEIALIERHGRVIGAVTRQEVVDHLQEYLIAERLENLRRRKR